MAEKRTIEIEVLRYNPEKDAAPHFQSFKVPFTDDTSVLQGLQYIKDHLDGSLTFRWSCRMAICGSCGKMVNGKPELSCHTFLRDYYPGPLRIEPLNHFPARLDLSTAPGLKAKAGGAGCHAGRPIGRAPQQCA
jgi:fumarate reductase iron-sulfur subunit